MIAHLRYLNNKKTDPSCCPVCGQNVRQGDLDSHFIQELEKLYKITSVNRCRRTGQYSSSTDESLENRWEAYLRIKSNRHCRMRMKSRKKKPDDVVCPICNENVYGNMQQLNNHVEICLRKHGTMEPEDDEEEETVDVEGDTYDNFQWSSPPRVPPMRILEVENHSAFHKEEANDQITDKDEESSLYGASVQYTETEVTNSEANHQPQTSAGSQDER
ncbi:Ring finger protein 220 [Nesidiocoris tenuis]|uniref:Ring finger protein 220 n=1 Tax=Nesidiocoris tenuis TaxID=355587 RepID=A0ABN7AF45_9HEMI|nr:Ring finger protein 220 [Nesidiocoris tenuis]